MLPFLLLASLVALKYINLYGKDVYSDAVYSLGGIDYNPDSKSANFQSQDIRTYSSSLCLGTLDLPDHDCFVYHELGNKNLEGKFKLFVSEVGIQRISFEASPEKLSVDVVEVGHGPTPNLLPEVPVKKPEQQQKKTVVRKRVVKNDNEEEIVVEEVVLEMAEEDTRSWVQKNWVYIVPPLIIFMLFAPADDKSSKN